MEPTPPPFHIAPGPLAAGLLTRRRVIVPTWRGFALLLILLAALMTWAFFGAYDFMAPNDPQPGGILVVEGWAMDNMLRAAVEEFRQHPYELLIVTGGPMEHGEPLSEYKTLPDLAVAIMEKWGMDKASMQAVPCPAMTWDRTYSSAMALKVWLREHHKTSAKINLFSSGFHARRSRMLFQQALGDEVKVGVIAYEYDRTSARQWWKSSEGIRSLIGETMAYIYARFFFRAPTEEQLKP